MLSFCCIYSTMKYATRVMNCFTPSDGLLIVPQFIVLCFVAILPNQMIYQIDHIKTAIKNCCIIRQKMSAGCMKAVKSRHDIYLIHFVLFSLEREKICHWIFITMYCRRINHLIYLFAKSNINDLLP